MEGTAISWADNTFNPWWGCKKVSPACRFCYAERDSARWGFDVWGSKAERRMMSDGYWRKPVVWNRRAQAAGKQLRVFCASMADVFDDHPAVVDARRRLFELIEATPWLIWMLLTKRPQNIAGMVPWTGAWPTNIWLGVSAETQRFANERIPHLIQHQAAVLFVSAAPQLGYVDLTRIPAGSVQQPSMVWDVLGKRYGVPDLWQAPLSRGVDWVITEGESGNKRSIRPSHPDWFRSLRNQCEAAGVPFHHKQNGEFTPNMPSIPDSTSPDGLAPDWDRKPDLWVCSNDGKVVRREVDVPAFGSWVAMYRVGKRAAGRVLDGQLWDQFPHPAPVAVK